MRILPLPIEIIYRDNKNYNILQTVFNNIKMDSDFETFELKKRILMSDVTLYNTYKKLFVSSKENIYSVILQLGYLVERYHNNSSIIRIIFDSIKRKHITISIATQKYGIKRIIISPWRSVIQTHDHVFDYSKNNKHNMRNKFCIIIYGLLNNFGPITNIHINTNIKTFQSIKQFELNI
jgi:hypothetical protein